MHTNVTQVGTKVVMPEWIKRAKPLPPDTSRKILRYFHVVSRPVFLGQISLEIGFSLNQTETWINDMVESGIIRPTTIAERLQANLYADAHVYVLVGKPDPRLAYLP